VAWAINDAALQTARQRHLLFHGGSAALNDQGVILPAPSRSGKTTLVAGLLMAGFEYFSDDVVVLERATGRLLPFAKCLSIKPGAQQRLLPLYPQLANGAVPHVELGEEQVWYLPPPSTALAHRSVPVRFVVLPRYSPRDATRLEPIARSSALECLLQQSFNVGEMGADGMRCAIDLVRGAECYALTVGDLEPAVDLIRALIQPDG
jgi:hypothetical protein